METDVTTIIDLAVRDLGFLKEKFIRASSRGDVNITEKSRLKKGLKRARKAISEQMAAI